MKRVTAILAWLISLAVVSAILTSGLIYTLTRQSLNVVQTWQQPADVQYDDASPHYYLSIVESDLDWRGFPLDVRRRYFIYVGRDAGRPTYGHIIDYSFHASGASLQNHIARSQVEWSSDGVTFREASGHVLFIPAEMFTGGR